MKLSTPAKQQSGIQLGLWDSPAALAGDTQTAAPKAVARASRRERKAGPLPAPAPHTPIVDDSVPAGETRSRAELERTYHPDFDTRLVQKIIRELEWNTRSGNRPAVIFQDWLNILDAMIEMQGPHVSALRAGKALPADLPHIAELWRTLQERYGSPEYFEHFARAYAFWIESSAQYQDVLGSIYMQWSNASNARTGQYFTPWDVARMMAEMAMMEYGAGGAAVAVQEQLDAAIAANDAAGAAMAGAEGLEGDQRTAWLIAFALPEIWAQFEPLLVNDPAVGSGIFLLAGASCLPNWMVKLGLVRFYGMDIDVTCVQMCRLNCRLYGLNGTGAGDVLSWAGNILAELPEPYLSRARELDAAGVEEVRRREQAAEKLGALLKELHAIQETTTEDHGGLSIHHDTERAA